MTSDPKSKPDEKSAEPKPIPQDEVMAALADALNGSDRGDDVLSAVKDLYKRQKALDLEVRRQRHDYTTILETVREISLKALDIPRFEQYTINTLRGQFGVLKVLFLRQAEHLDENLAVHTARILNPPDLRIGVASDFVQFLTEHRVPLSLDPVPPPIADDADVNALLAEGIVLVVPLVKKDESGELALKGLIGMGPRIGKLPYTPKDREFLALLGSMVGISLHNAHLYHRSIVDGLTQVYSRGHFDIHLEQELQRVRRYNAAIEKEQRGTPTGVTLVLLDIDDFKSFNDTYGHLIGDLVLHEVACTLQLAVRAMDVVCRYGGEEFGIIFPDSTPDVAVPIAQRMRIAVQDRKIHTSEFGELSVTISVGVGTYPQDGDDVRGLIAAADAAMYQAKDAGKNCVIAAGTYEAKTEAEAEADADAKAKVGG